MQNETQPNSTEQKVADLANRPEAMAARASAQSQILWVIEAMLDGDYDDARHHLDKWQSMRLYAMECEGLITTINLPNHTGKSLNEIRLA